MTLLSDPQSAAAPKPIPTHKGHWLWGGTFDFQNRPADFVLEGHERYGDIFKTRVLYGHSYFIRDPEIVNAINVTHAKQIYKPKIVKQMWRPFLGNGLVPNDGESWKRQHKLIMPAFHKNAGFLDVFPDCKGLAILSAGQVEDVVAFLKSLKE